MEVCLRHPKLGQHFLKDARFCQRFADSLSIEPDDLVIEIGAGRGALTRFLASRARRLVAVEIDPALAARLRDEFLGNARVEILEEDILKVDLAALARERHFDACFACGNLPYYITSPILRHLFNARASIRRMALLMQREVAERVTAAPGSRAYGYLSVLAQCYSRPQPVLKIPPGAFSPPPEVHSMLVDFPIASRFSGWAAADYAAFLNFAQRCFRQKRKSLVNNLSEKQSRAGVQRVLEEHGLKENIRAEQLSVAQLAGLFQAMGDGVR
ncbi:MAG: 16S rRNA (adenine(1518)-N(6)/adenine(1519)-N(6))-dimethyltransferase RsmA [Terriglobia bacterium]